MKQSRFGIAALILSVIALIAVAYAVTLGRSGGPAPTAESRLDRLREKGELRVGYIVFPPYISRDSRTGRMSGIFATMSEELARNLGVRLVWVEEVNLTNLAVGFEGNRFDMIVTPLWRSADRAKVVEFSTPLFYSVVGSYVRANDNRFDGNLSRLNDPGTRIAAIDGELAGEIARVNFPRARVNALPQLVDYSQLMTEVASQKADATFYNRIFARRFMRRNPGRIKEVPGVPPIRVFAECFILPAGDPRFASLINAGLSELLDNGGLERAMVANGENPSEYYLRAPPYREPPQ